MRHSNLCGGEIRLEFYVDKGEAKASVGVINDFEDRPAAQCDVNQLRGVLQGGKYHLAGPGWLCTLVRSGEMIELDLWRESQPARRCQVPVNRFAEALQEAYGVGSTAYVA